MRQWCTKLLSLWTTLSASINKASGSSSPDLREKRAADRIHGCNGKEICATWTTESRRSTFAQEAWAWVTDYGIWHIGQAGLEHWMEQICLLRFLLRGQGMSLHTNRAPGWLFTSTSTFIGGFLPSLYNSNEYHGFVFWKTLLLVVDALPLYNPVLVIMSGRLARREGSKWHITQTHHSG